MDGYMNLKLKGAILTSKVTVEMKQLSAWLMRLNYNNSFLVCRMETRGRSAKFSSEDWNWRMFNFPMWFWMKLWVSRNPERSIEHLCRNRNPREIMDVVSVVRIWRLGSMGDPSCRCNLINLISIYNFSLTLASFSILSIARNEWTSDVILNNPCIIDADLSENSVVSTFIQKCRLKPTLLVIRWLGMFRPDVRRKTVLPRVIFWAHWTLKMSWAVPFSCLRSFRTLAHFGTYSLECILTPCAIRVRLREHPRLYIKCMRGQKELISV